MNRRCKMETPLAVSGFEVWKLPKRSASPSWHDWSVGVRPGPSPNNLSGQALPTPPPAIRKSALREVPSLLGSPDQMGFPPCIRYNGIPIARGGLPPL